MSATNSDPVRLLTIMGSGETAPAMRRVHAAVFDRLGAEGEVPAVFLDTPFGFQENAAELAAKATAYIGTSVGRPMEVAGLPRLDGRDGLAREQGLARLRAARDRGNRRNDWSN